MAAVNKKKPTERDPAGTTAARPRLALVGSPNVGKSSLFNRLTNSYLIVSNYPGTTVEVSRGQARIGNVEFEVIDTPGLYSLLPLTEEERVARDILRLERPELVLHVIDAKNLERMLPLTFQLKEAGLSLVLVLNIMDDAEKLGLRIDLERLERELGLPAAATVSTTGRGIEKLKEIILSAYEQRKT